MRHITPTCIIIPLIIFCQSAFASKVDSLLNIIDSSKDTAVYRHYENLINELLEDPDSALYYSDIALKLSLENKHSFFEGKIRLKRGSIFARLGNMEQCLQEHKYAHKIFTNLNEEYYIHDANISIGIVNMELGQFDKASERFIQSLEVVEKKQYEDLLSKCYSSLGLLFFKQKNYEQSVKYYQKALIIRKKIKKLSSLALTYNNIGISYYYLDMFDSVLISFERSLKIYEDIGDKFGQVRPLTNIGEIFYIKGENDKALEYYHKALDIDMEIDNKIGYSTCLMSIGKIYAEQNNFKKALEYQRKGYKHIKELKIHPLLLDAYEYLYNTFDLMNNSDSALSYYKNFVALKDSLYNLKNSKQIAELEKIYETEKKDNEILRLQQEQDKKKNQIILLLALIILSILISIIIAIYHKTKNKNLVLKTITLEQKKQFGTVLKAQEDERKRIAGDLHDSVGPLLSVSQLYMSDAVGYEGLDKDTCQTIEKAIKVLNEATNEVRDISRNLMPGVLVRSGLAPACRELLRRVDETKCAQITFKAFNNDNEKRFNESIEIGFYRIFQELVNNVLKHANASKIHIELSEHEGELILLVLDNGVGFGTCELENAQGIGLQNINSRLSLINGQIRIRSSKNGGTEIRVSAPIG